MKNTEISSGARLLIYNGAKHYGSLQIASGAIVNIIGTIDFTIADRQTGDDYLINDLSLLSNSSPTYTVTVSENNEFGTYKLAQGAQNFSKKVSIGSENVNYGTLTVNNKNGVVYNDIRYTLTQEAGNLTLTIAKSDTIPPAAPVAKTLYRVRKSWKDAASQKGAFADCT
jgi:hypothetical protein